MFAAIVLAGGGGRRLGGVLKPALTVAGVPMLERVVTALGDVRPIIVVGPATLPVPVGAIRVEEVPAGGGPVAGIGAALAAMGSLAMGSVAVGTDAIGLRAMGTAAMGSLVMGSDAPEITVIVGGDLPILTAPDVTRLVDALADDVDGAVYVDGTGRPQWLCGAWRTRVVADRLAAFAGEHGGLRDGSLRALFGPMRFAEIRVNVGDGVLPPYFDCDTEDEIRQAEEWYGR